MLDDVIWGPPEQNRPGDPIVRHAFVILPKERKALEDRGLAVTYDNINLHRRSRMETNKIPKRKEA